MARVFSGMQPSGDATLGSLLGALRNWVDAQNADAYYCVVDLHALTFPQDPAELRQRTLELATVFLAVGLDPEVSTLFVQSHVHEHTELAWLMECTAAYGELSRMTQFKDKSAKREFISAGLFTYPALMAADILLYDTEEVPVGDDQRQHVEFTRDVAERFNSRYGPTFRVPKAVIGTAGARVMDLQEPTRKMSKSEDSPAGTVLVLEDLDAVAKKIKRAVTGTDYDPAQPGAANLLSIRATWRSIVQSSGGRWCSRVQASVNGSLPAMPRRSPPSSGCKRYSPTRRVKPRLRIQSRACSRPTIIPHNVATTRP